MYVKPDSDPLIVLDSRLEILKQHLATVNETLSVSDRKTYQKGFCEGHRLGLLQAIECLNNVRKTITQNVK